MPLDTCECQIAQCGQAGKVAVATFGNDRETGLWFARQVGAIIGSHHLDDHEIQTAVQATYSQYVIAASLRPALAANDFYFEVRRSAQEG